MTFLQIKLFEIIACVWILANKLTLKLQFTLNRKFCQIIWWHFKWDIRHIYKKIRWSVLPSTKNVPIWCLNYCKLQVFWSKKIALGETQTKVQTYYYENLTSLIVMYHVTKCNTTCLEMEYFSFKSYN